MWTSPEPLLDCRRLADAVVRDGPIVQQGKPRELYEQPATDFVAAFVGKTNIFSGRVTTRTRFVEISTARSRPSCRPAIVFDPSQNWQSSFSRYSPEAMEVKDLRHRCPQTNQITGQILASAYQGAFVEYELLALGRTVKAQRLIARGNGFSTWRAGLYLLRSRRRNSDSGKLRNVGCPHSKNVQTRSFGS